MHSTPSNIWSISIVLTPKLGCQPAQRLVHSIRQYYRSARRLQSRDDWWRLPLRLWATSSKRKRACQANEFPIRHCQITIYRHVALMSLQLIKELVDFRVPHLPTERINIRIGIHCGMKSSLIVGIANSPSLYLKKKIIWNLKNRKQNTLQST